MNNSYLECGNIGYSIKWAHQICINKQVLLPWELMDKRHSDGIMHSALDLRAAL